MVCSVSITFQYTTVRRPMTALTDDSSLGIIFSYLPTVKNNSYIDKRVAFLSNISLRLTVTSR